MSAEVTPIRRQATSITIPGDLSETGLVLPEGLSFDEWETIGKKLQRVEKSVRWWIGDWLAYGERVYGETYAQAIEATGYSVGDLQNMVYVASGIEPSQRCENLSWSHHREVAALSPPEQTRWLDKAEAESWSTRELREQMVLTRDHAPSAERIPKCNKCGTACRVCEIEILGRQKKGRKR